MIHSPKGRRTFKIDDLTPKNKPAMPLCRRTCRTDEIPVEYCSPM